MLASGIPLVTSTFLVYTLILRLLNLYHAMENAVDNTTNETNMQCTMGRLGVIHRGYYMATRRYKIYLRVLKNIHE